MLHLTRADFACKTNSEGPLLRLCVPCSPCSRRLDSCRRCRLRWPRAHAGHPPERTHTHTYTHNSSRMSTTQDFGSTRRARCLGGAQSVQLRGPPPVRSMLARSRRGTNAQPRMLTFGAEELHPTEQTHNSTRDRPSGQRRGPLPARCRLVRPLLLRLARCLHARTLAHSFAWCVCC